MRLNNLLGLAVAIASLGMVAAPQSASATHWYRTDGDPYEYRYEPRGYYPYYNSNYWGPPRIKRFRGHVPPYYAAWGAPRRGYNHVEWHVRHYGGHRRGDW